MKKRYNYAVIQPNYPALKQANVLLDNKYNAKKKYAFIQKIIHKDGSESIGFIKYSNDLEDLQNKAKEFPSWYNYPIGIAKNIQGYLREI